MTDSTASRHIHIPHWTQRWGIGGFLVIILVGAVYSITSLTTDLIESPSGNLLVFLLLGVALLIALGFEFVNGFHDTANAVATVIYTHSLPAYIAVVWSGMFNFLGVLVSSGAVAFAIISLLPVELILQVGSHAGFAMVFALLIAAIIWNLGTWYLGLPSSSSHTLIGSIIGVGLMNQMMASGNSGTSGVDWGQAIGIGKSLLFSPLIGFFAAGLLLIICKAVIRIPALYQAPKGSQPPPLWIRGLLILTCTGVSFAHGSNDGQKGMGLIMLILIGTVPTAYALNHSVGKDKVEVFVADSARAVTVLEAHGGGVALTGEPRQVLTTTVEKRAPQAQTVPALAKMIADTSASVAGYGTLAAVPTAKTANVRNDMYLISETLGDAEEEGLAEPDPAAAGGYRQLQERYRQRDQVHSDLGQGRRRHRPWPRHHGRLEAHRGDRGREDRQDPHDLCPGCLGRAGGHADHRGGGYVRPAGQHDPCALLRRRRDHGGQSVGAADVDGAQSDHGLGSHLAGLDRPRRGPLLAVPPPRIGPGRGGRSLPPVPFGCDNPRDGRHPHRASG